MSFQWPNCSCGLTGGCELCNPNAYASSLPPLPKEMVVHCKGAPYSYDVYIGRPSKWGNPFIIGQDGSRAEVIEKYRVWIKTQPQLMRALSELQNKVLGCWCSPQACHGDVLIELLEQQEKSSND